MIWLLFNLCQRFRAVLPGLIILFSAGFAEAATLLWDRNTETNVIGYRVYVGSVSRTYDLVLDRGNSTFADVPTNPGMNYFAVTAYDQEGLESGYSAEVTYLDGVANLSPVTGADSYSTPRDTTLNTPAPGLLANDSDPEGQPLNAVLVNAPAHGTLVLGANGSFSYTPAANYTGADSFTYQASDGVTISSAATVSLNVTTPPLNNTTPLAWPDAYTMAKNTSLSVSDSGVLSNDTDADGQTLTALLVSAPTRGSLSLNASGSFTYTPTTGFSGSDSFQYRASDGFTSSVATVTITIIGSTTTNSPPVAQADSYIVAQDKTLIITPAAGVLANDFDVDGHILTVVQQGNAAHGDVALFSDGGFYYTPVAGYTGPDSFGYRAHDGFIYSASVTVSLVVTGAATVNTAPVALPDNFALAKNRPLTIAAPGVLANDSDVDGQTLAAFVVGSATGGTVTLNANGGFAFTPSAGFTGIASFNYRANDGSLNATNTVTLSVTNTPPVATSDSYATVKNIGLNIAAVAGVLANDSDANGDPLTASVITAPANGALALNANGSFTFTPTANYTGADSFTYRVSDGALFSASATVSLTINNSNGAPVAVAENYSLAKNTTLNIAAEGVLANDSDPEGNTLFATLVTAPASGLLTLSASGGFSYTPAAGFTGNASFVYRASDGTSNSANTTVTLSVTNTPPIATADSFATLKNIGLTIAAGAGLLINDADANGDTLTASVVTAPARGTLILNANGGFTFNPTANYVGPDSFTYRVSDGSLFSANATVTLTINNSNAAPVTVPNSYALAKNVPLAVAAPGVLANDSDVDGTPLTALLITSPASGTLAFEADGSFLYTPAQGFTGAASFTYRASDGVTNSASTTVTLNITNTPPVASADSFVTLKNIGLTVAANSGVLANDTDANDDALTASVVSAPTRGTLALNSNGSFTFTPNANYVGTDSFTYRAYDGTANSASTTVTISINNSNGAPVAASENFAGAKNTTLNIPAAGVLANDSDPDGNVLTAVLVTGPANGALVLNGNGGFSYTPAFGFIGGDSFTYRATDGSLNSASTTVTLNITNTPPVSSADSFATVKNIGLSITGAGVLANDSDANGDALTAFVVTPPANGALTLNANGTFTFNPAANFVGTDSFTYRASDGAAFSASATVTVTINNSNAAPVALEENYALAKNVPRTVAAPGVLANDSDPDGQTLTAVVVGSATGGSVLLSANGGFTFTPTAGFTGAASFTYRASDGATNSSNTTVTLNITNTPPVANNDGYATSKNIGLNVIAANGVLADDTDFNGDPLTASLVAAPAQGTLTFNANGSFNFSPTANYTGTDSFTYRVTDGALFSANATVSLTINNSNGAPVAVADSYALAKSTTLTVPSAGVLANDSDPDADTLSATLVSGPAHGTLSLNPNGGFTFTAAANYVGADSFIYRASDGSANSASITVTLSITNTAPVANPESYVTAKNLPLVIAANGVLANDTDAEGNALTAAVVGTATGGSVSLNANGGFTFTPAANFTGAATFTYRANDGTVNSANALVTINVTNTPPVANNDNYLTSKNIGLMVNAASGLLADDSDPNGDALTASVVTAPAFGTLNLSANGSFTFTPAANYVGGDSFTYRVSDGALFSAPATVSLTINSSNGAPVAGAENYSFAKNTPRAIATAAGVLANDSDPDGDDLTATLITAPASGALALNADGSFNYSPAANFTGNATFVYRATDGETNSASTTVTLSVTNNPPVAVPDSFSTRKNIGLNVPALLGLLANDADANGDALTASVVTAPAHGTLSLSANGSFTFTPTVNYFGLDSFTYRVSDGSTFSPAATVTISINNSNGAPVAVGENYSLPKNSTLNVPALGVLANDTDPDGDILTSSLVSGPAHGSITLNANGNFIFTPTPGYAGVDSFTYRSSDGALNSANATVNLSITNTAPVANGDSYATLKNIGLNVSIWTGLLADDTDANGDDLTASLVTAPTHGSLDLNADGSFTFTPNANFTGSGSFTYRVSDGTAFSANATVTITVQNSNAAPVAVADTFSTRRNTALTLAAASGVLANDTDADGDTLTAMLVSLPARGTLTLNADGSLNYAPTNLFVGADSFAYRANDGVTNSGISTVTINVLPPSNVAPVARNENYSVTRNTLLTIAPSGVLANDTDADGNALFAALVTGPAHGTVALNTNGGFSYTPVANFTGADSFTYRALDGLTNSGAATVFITVQLPVNTPPVATGESYATVRGVALSVGTQSGVLANDTDVDGNTLTVSLAVPVANGTLVLAPGGSFLYTPRAGFTGVDGFSYRVSDGIANTTAVATIRVNEPPAANVPPVAALDHYDGLLNQTLVLEAHSGVLVNDTDANGDVLTAVLASGTTHGALTFNGDGSFTYVPGVDFLGVDSFSYYASDGSNSSATITATISVNPPPPENIAPVAVADTFAALKNTPLYMSWLNGVLKNDSDADGDTMMVSLVTPPDHGTVTLNWNGGFVFTPPADFLGMVQFSYEANDGLDSSETTIVTITVTEPVQTNAIPVPVSDTYFTTRNTALEIPSTSGVLINDSDADADPLFAGLVLPPAHGTVVLNLDGSFSYTPEAEFVGHDTFAYEVSDTLDVSMPTLVTITVSDNTTTIGGCQNCFAELDEVMAARSAVFATAIRARQAVPTNATCSQYGVLLFRTMTPQLGPLHDSTANKALGEAGNCVAELLGTDLAAHYTRAATLAPSKYTKSASNYLDGIVTTLAGMTTTSNNSSRSKLLVAAANAFVRADKSLASGNLALAALEGRVLTCTFTRAGQTSRGTFVFGADTFVVEDSNGVPIKTGHYNYTRTAWNGGVLQVSFDQPTLGYQTGELATWTFKFARTKHKLTAPGLRGYFTSL